VPAVAVLLPARDAERTIRGAVVSILRQTFRDVHLLVVDDGSRDRTGELLAALAARDPRLEVISGPGEGIAPALQRGLARCDAPVIARMDADDVAHPQRLERQLAALVADPELVALGSQVRLFPRTQVRLGMQRYAEWVNGLTTPERVARDLLVEAPLIHPSALIRSAPLRAVGGWRDGPFPEDYDLWLRLAAAGGKLGNVPAPLLDWRESSGRLTRQDPRYGLDRHRALKAAFLRAGPLSEKREVAIWGAGPTGKAVARALEAEGLRAALFVDVDPKKIGRQARGAPIVGPDQLERARGLPLLVAVGAHGARELIRAELAKQGWAELREYWCVA
jgi:glycosyltransferase involved in cell wall biosynthesis